MTNVYGMLLCDTRDSSEQNRPGPGLPELHNKGLWADIEQRRGHMPAGARHGHQASVPIEWMNECHINAASPQALALPHTVLPPCHSWTRMTWGLKLARSFRKLLGDGWMAVRLSSG